MRVVSYLVLGLVLTHSALVELVPSSGTPPQPRQGSTLVYSSNKLYLLGGYENAGNYFEDIWSFDLGTKAWKQLQQVNQGPGKR